MAYIDRDLLLNCLEDLAHENLIGNDNDTFISLPEAQDRIEELSTADVVEVVRCKDCEHRKEDFCFKVASDVVPKKVKGDFYCGYGERKEVEQ